MKEGEGKLERPREKHEETQGDDRRPTRQTPSKATSSSSRPRGTEHCLHSSMTSLAAYSPHPSHSTNEQTKLATMLRERNDCRRHGEGLRQEVSVGRKRVSVLLRLVPSSPRVFRSFRRFSFRFRQGSVLREKVARVYLHTSTLFTDPGTRPVHLLPEERRVVETSFAPVIPKD